MTRSVPVATLVNFKLKYNNAASFWNLGGDGILNSFFISNSRRRNIKFCKCFIMRDSSPESVADFAT